MSYRSFLSFVFAVAVSLVVAPAGLAENEAQRDAEQLRDELVSFFAQSEELAPTAIGEVGSESRSFESIQRRIGQLSRDELSAIREGLAGVPNWQMAPEALVAALPGDARQQLEALSRTASQQADELERFRGELSTLYAAVQLLPADMQRQIRGDRQDLSAMQREIHGMNTQGLAMARGTLGSGSDWQSVRSEMFAHLSPRVGRYAEQLAQHGPLTADEISELRTFQHELEVFFTDLARLPEEHRGRFDAAKIAGTRERLSQATPEMIFVLRQEIDSPELRQSMQEVRLLATAGRLDDAERTALHGFRAELGQLFVDLSESVTEGQQFTALSARLEEMGDEELLLTRSRIESIRGWQHTLPLLLRAADSEPVQQELAALRNGVMPQERLVALEGFRQELVGFYGGLAPTGEDDPELTGALDQLRQANAAELILMREVWDHLGDADTPSAESRVQRTTRRDSLIDLPYAVRRLNPISAEIDLNCVVSLGSIDLPLGIGKVSLGSINFNFICNPIESAINLAASAIEAIEGVIDDVFTAVVNLPQTLLDALQSLFASIADAALGAFSPENLQNALGLNGNFWENLPEVPQIPCPPDGSTIPFFGEVGEEETAAKYNRYLWVFDKVLGLIPDTEISLAIKIPAQILYAGVEYVGVCLDAAADMRAGEATDAFRAGVFSAFDETRVGITGVDDNLQAGFGQLSMQIAGQGADLNALIVQTGADLSSQISQSGADIGDQLSEVEQRMLKLEIEQNLLEQGQDRIAAFVRPQAFGGHLELVREVVDEAIALAQASGGNVGCAMVELGRGDDALAIGDYSRAFDRFRSAYRDVVKASFDGTSPACQEQ